MIFQAYDAQFRLQHIAATGMNTVYSDQIQNTDMHVAMLILSICLNSLLSEITAFIHSKASSQIKADKSSPIPAISTRTLNRETSLKTWADFDNPFSSATPSPISTLIKALARDPRDASDVISFATPARISHRDLADHVLTIASSSSLVRQFPAPFPPKSFSLHLFRQANTLLRSYHHSRRTTANMLARQLADKRIALLPWHDNPTANQGANPSVLTLTTWKKVGDGAKPAPTVRTIVHDDPVSRRAAEVAQQIRDEDPYTEWNALDVDLVSLRDILHYRHAPKEWDIDNATLGQKKDEFTISVYDWAFDGFDLTKALCRLSLILSIIMTKMVPDVFMNGKDDAFAVFDKCREYDKRTPLLREVPWILNKAKARHGSKFPLPYITMATVYIWAFIDPKSPMHAQIRRNGGAGEAWTSKHSKQIFLLLSWITSLRVMFRQ